LNRGIRTQSAEIAAKHLCNSLHMFLQLIWLTRSLDRQTVNRLIEACDYEGLD
jgi:hypothetical protein